MKTIAARDYGWVPAAPGQPGADRRQLPETRLRRVLHEAGFQVDRVQSFSYLASFEEQRAWLSVPVFTTRLFGSLPYEQRMTDAAVSRHTDLVTEAW